MWKILVRLILVAVSLFYQAPRPMFWDFVNSLEDDNEVADQIMSIPPHYATYVNNVQKVSITIANNSLTGTATINAAVGKQFIVWNGETTTTSATSSRATCYLTISGTTITATRGAQTNADGITVLCTVVDGDSTNMVKTVQTGTVTVSTGSASGTATISSVTATNTVIHMLGWTADVSSYQGSPVISFSGTTVTAALAIGVSGNLTVGFTVIEFQSGALNSNTQSVQKSWTTSGTTSTSTITSVTTGNTMLFWCGCQQSSSFNNQDFAHTKLTNSTTVTFTVQSTNSAAIKNYVYVCEFKTAVMASNAQRGTIAITATSNTATVTGTGTNSMVVHLGWNTNSNSFNQNNKFSRLDYTSPTVTCTINSTASTNVTTSYEVIDWAVAVTGIAFDAASNSGYQSPSSSYSWSHTCTGSNGFLGVDVAILSVPGTTVSGITYNSVNLILIGAQNVVGGTGRIEAWGLVAPATGSHTIAVTLSASIASAAGAVSYSGVQQVTPTEKFSGNSGINTGTGTNATVIVTPLENNDWVHAALATSATAVTASQTTRNNVTGTLGSGANEDTGPITPAAATTMTYTGEGITDSWAICGYGIIPVGDPNDYNLTVTDAPTISESMSQVGTYIRTATDAPAISGSMSQAGVYVRATTDSPTIGQSVTRTGAFVRTATDAPLISESITRTVTLLRMTNESPTLADVATATKIIVRAATESPHTADSVTRLFVGQRIASESPATSESVTTVKSLFRTATESLNTTDAATGVVVIGPRSSLFQGGIFGSRIFGGGM